MCYLGWTCVVLIMLQLLNGGLFLAKGDDQASKSCQTHERLNQCIMKSQNFSDIQQRLFVANEAELNNVCRTLNVQIECIEEYIAMCFDQTDKKKYERMIASSMGITENLCYNLTFRNEYLSHARCFNSSTFSNEQLCTTSYSHFIAESLSVTDPRMQANDSLVKYCCAYSNFITCISEQVLSNCEESTVIYFQNFMKSAMKPLQLHCKNYTVGSVWCSRASTFNLQLVSLMLPFAFLSIMSFTR